MSTPSPKEALLAMHEIADVASRVIHRQVGEAATTKNDGTPITASDQWINDYALAALLARFPQSGVLGEEASISTDSDSGLFVIDPIDGTAPYCAGLGIASFSVSYVIDEVTRAAVIDDPFTATRFSTLLGEGAFMNTAPLWVPNSPRANVVQLEAFGATPDLEAALFSGLRNAKANPVRFLSFAGPSCRVASGAFAGALFGHYSFWDTLATSLIARESGAKVTNLSGDNFLGLDLAEGIIISHPDWYEKLLAVVCSARTKGQL